MGDRPNRFQIRHFQSRIAHRFAEQHLGFVGDGAAEVLRVARVYHPHSDAKLRQDIFEHGVGTAVQRVRRHHFIAHLANVDNAVEHGAGA